MKAYLTEPPGGRAATKITEVPLIAGSPDRALVSLRAVSLNPADAFQIDGRYPGAPKPPFITGRDASGVVVQGDAQGTWKPGDRVILLQSAGTDLRNGTLCEQQWLSAENLTKLPEGWSFSEGAAGPLVYLTAWKALNWPKVLQADQVVLVTGASGGVGVASVHLARGLGATVVALSRSEVKRKKLLEQGAHFAFDPNEDNLKEKIDAATGRKGVDVVVENVGGPMLTLAVRLLAVHGRLGVVGVLAGVESVLPIPSFMFKRASLNGILVSDDNAAQSQAAWKNIIEVLSKMGKRPIIDRVFPFEQTSAAFDHLRGDVFGKVVVEIAKG